MIKRYRHLNKLILQDTFTDLFFEEEKKTAKHQLLLVYPFLKDGSVLDIDTGLGYVPSLLRERGIDAYGIHYHDEFMEFWKDKPFLQHTTLKNLSKNKKFDNIIMSNYLEYSYCPHSEIIEAFVRLNNQGRCIVLVYSNNSPKKSYCARSQEFSTKSALMFAKNCSPSSKVKSFDNEELLVINN